MEIEYDLKRWAQWVRETENLQIKPLAMFDDGLRTGSGSPSMSDEEGLAFEQSMIALKQIDKELFNVARLRYIYGMSYRTIGLIVMQPSKTVYCMTQEALAFLAGFWAGKAHEAAKIATIAAAKSV